MDPIVTERLKLRAVTPEDAPFMLELLNGPSFIANIGDRGVRTVEHARDYIEAGAMKQQAALGYSAWLMERREDSQPVGICGLIVRAMLHAPDLGYALLPRFEGQGYAREAARACVEWAKEHLASREVLAIVAPGNSRSIALLRDLGFRYVEQRPLGPRDVVDLYSLFLGPR